MTQGTQTRNPAAAKLESLARCQKIRPFQAGDDDLLCGNDMIAIVPTLNGYVHDPSELRRLREMTYDGRWPR